MLVVPLAAAEPIAESLDPDGTRGIFLAVGGNRCGPPDEIGGCPLSKTISTSALVLGGACRPLEAESGGLQFLGKSALTPDLLGERGRAEIWSSETRRNTEIFIQAPHLSF